MVEKGEDVILCKRLALLKDFIHVISLVMNVEFVVKDCVYLFVFVDFLEWNTHFLNDFISDVEQVSS